jgi:hypothetical protein
VTDSYSRWRPHPWHGLEPGADAPRVVNAYIAVTGRYGFKEAAPVISASIDDYREMFSKQA